jgi:PIN domain nuclease of toxin-antitoxin system
VKVLADTHVLIWAIDSPHLVSARAKQAMEKGDVIVSIASLWELIVKKSKKGALLEDPVTWWKRKVIGTGLSVLGIRSQHVIALDDLASIHADPFDRILIAQSIVEDATLVSKDRHLKHYGVPVVW